MELTTAQSIVLFARIWIGATGVAAATYGAFTLLIRWLKTRHRWIFEKYLPEYLEEEEES